MHDFHKLFLRTSWHQLQADPSAADIGDMSANLLQGEQYNNIKQLYAIVTFQGSKIIFQKNTAIHISQIEKF